MSQSLHPNQTLVEAQLGLHFAVGPAGEPHEASNAERQTNSHSAVLALFNERAMALLGKPDPSVSESFSNLPYEVCECEWESQDVDGQAVYSVWFHSSAAIDQNDATKLRALALEAYASVCGRDARFVRAELYQRWAYTTRTPFVFAD